MMQSKTIRILLLASLLFAGRGVFADDVKKELLPEPPQPNIRIEALLVAMPEEKFITLLPDLQDNKKIGGAVAQMLEAVKRKEMILRGCPTLVTQNGQRSVSGVTREIKDTMDPAPPDPMLVSDTHQTIPLGVTMEVEAVLSPDYQIIDIDIAMQDIDLPKGDENTSAMLATITKDHDPKNNPARPAYVTMKNTTSLTLRNGHYGLLGTHKMIQSPVYVKVVVVRAVVVPVERK